MTSKPTTKLKKKADNEDEAIIKDLDIHLEEDLQHNDEDEEKSQLPLSDEEGTVLKPSLTGEAKPKKTDYEQPGTNNIKRTVIEE